MELSKTTNTLKSRTVPGGHLENGVIQLIIFEGVEQVLDDVRENLNALRKLSIGKTSPAPFDLSALKSVTGEARENYSGLESAKVRFACALLIGNPVSKLPGNFYTSLNASLMPAKLITNKDKAMEWLESIFEYDER